MAWFCLAALSAAPPEIVSVRRIWDRATHNAFTDLIRFQDRWYCTFREAEGHVGGDGRLRLLVSPDGETWESAALVSADGIDLRDPKLSITPDGRLMLLAGGSVYQGRVLLGRRPRVAFSSDGRRWSTPRPILAEGDWLWRVTWRQGRAYGISYRTDPRRGILYSSPDGIEYQKVTDLDLPGAAEATLRFLPDGEMIALVRREGDTRRGSIGVSRAPYQQWEWREIPHRLGGPNFLLLPDGRFWAGSRDLTGEARTALARMDRQSYEPVLTLPSGGDTSYPGLVWHDNLLWMSYYSSHQGKAAIYLAKIRLEP